MRDKERHSTELKKQAKDHQIKINIWEESNKNLQDEMSLQKSIFEKKSNEVSDLKATINEMKNEISVLKKSSMNSQQDIIHETGEKVKYESYVKLCQKKSVSHLAKILAKSWHKYKEKLMNQT